MKISFCPVRSDERFQAVVSGDTLTIDGDAGDFGALQEGDTLPRDAVDCPWLASDVTRENGEICLTLKLPHGANAPDETRFPQPVTVADGPVLLPPYDTAPEEGAEA